MPPQILAFATSVVRSATVAKWRSPSPVTLGTVKSIQGVPRNRAMTRPPAGVMQEWALGYSGWLGVAARSVVQSGSPTVDALPSVSPARIAVIGRQNAKWYLASQQFFTAAASATE